MKRFNEGDFVHQATAGGSIKMVKTVRRRSEDPEIDRLDLVDVSGGVLNNVGAYELTEASDAEVSTALAAAGRLTP
jgi:hypothetical protein